MIPGVLPAAFAKLSVSRSICFGRYAAAGDTQQSSALAVLVVMEAAKLDRGSDLRAKRPLIVVGQPLECIAERDQRAVVEPHGVAAAASKEGERLVVGLVCVDEQL